MCSIWCSYLQEHREKIKAEAVGLQFATVPVSLEQTSFDESPTFSMDDFEGETLCRGNA